MPLCHAHGHPTLSPLTPAYAALHVNPKLCTFHTGLRGRFQTFRIRASQPRLPLCPAQPLRHALSLECFRVCTNPLHSLWLCSDCIANTDSLSRRLLWLLQFQYNLFLIIFRCTYCLRRWYLRPYSFLPARASHQTAALFQLSCNNPSLHTNVPLLLRFTSAKRHDSVSFLIASIFLLLYPELSQLSMGFPRLLPDNRTAGLLPTVL